MPNPKDKDNGREPAYADQAQGLRELMGKWDFDEKEVSALREDRNPLDYRKLWDGLKASLEFDATHYDLDMIEGGEDRGKIIKKPKSLAAQELLDRMLQAETLMMTKEVRP